MYVTPYARRAPENSTPVRSDSDTNVEASDSLLDAAGVSWNQGPSPLLGLGRAPIDVWILGRCSHFAKRVVTECALTSASVWQGRSDMFCVCLASTCRVWMSGGVSRLTISPLTHQGSESYN